VNMIASK